MTGLPAQRIALQRRSLMRLRQQRSRRCAAPRRRGIAAASSAACARCGYEQQVSRLRACQKHSAAKRQRDQAPTKRAPHTPLFCV